MCQSHVHSLYNLASAIVLQIMRDVEGVRPPGEAGRCVPYYDI